MTTANEDTLTSAAGGSAASSGTAPTLPAPSGDLRERIHRAAGMAHQAIDNLEQRFGSTSQGLKSAQGKGGEQVRQYGGQLRERIDAQPLQSIGIAFGAGVVLGKLFGSRPPVRVVRVESSTPPDRDRRQSAERRAGGLMEAARSHLEHLAEMGQTARERVGEAAGAGIAQTHDMSSALARRASDLPAQLRLAMDRLFSRSQDYGSTARSVIQEHPAAGLGAVLGLGALVTTLWMQRRRDEQGTPQVTYDENGNRVAWPHDQPGLRYRTQDMISARPVTSAAVMLGLGVLVAAMLKRR